MKRIVCLGGGPAGLYSAILFKKALPNARVEVYERNRPDDTFGWGVVFSDKTMAGSEQRRHPRTAVGVTLDFRLTGESAARCRGTITGKDWMKPELQAKYNGWFCWYLQRKIAAAGNPGR